MQPTRSLRFLLVALGLMCGGIAQARDFDDSELKHIGFPDWFVGNDFNDLSEELQTALDAGKKGLMLVWVSEGCSYCSIFVGQTLQDPEIAAQVQSQFHSTGLDIFDDTAMITPAGEEMSIKEFALSNGVEYSPALMFFGPGGEQLLSKPGLMTAERFRLAMRYVAEGHHQTETFGAFVNRLQQDESTAKAAALIENRHFEPPPYALDRSQFPASRSLLVLFERKGCEDCAEFHRKVLQNPDVDQLLEDLQVVRLDVDDTTTPVLDPSGKHTSPADWYLAEDFSHTPAMALYDPNGKLAMKTDEVVGRQRMLNSINYMRNRLYEKDWTYQQFARSEGLRRAAEAREKEQSQEN